MSGARVGARERSLPKGGIKSWFVSWNCVRSPSRSPFRNAYIDFTKMTASLVAVVTDLVKAGRRVVGYGFNSNGRDGFRRSDDA